MIRHKDKGGLAVTEYIEKVLFVRKYENRFI